MIYSAYSFVKYSYLKIVYTFFRFLYFNLFIPFNITFR